LPNNSRPAKGIYKNSQLHQKNKPEITDEGTRVQAKGIHKIFNKIIAKFSKSQESCVHSGTGSLHNTKQT
jgi:hypothetical protein